jgi:hypothetical protein
MAGKKFTVEQIVARLREVERFSNRSERCEVMAGPRGSLTPPVWPRSRGSAGIRGRKGTTPAGSQGPSRYR